MVCCPIVQSIRLDSAIGNDWTVLEYYLSVTGETNA